MLMMNRIKKIPMQLSAVMLGMAALGNLWQNELKILHTVCGILAFILAAVILLRAAVLRDGLKKDFAVKYSFIMSVPALPAHLMI